MTAPRSAEAARRGRRALGWLAALALLVATLGGPAWATASGASPPDGQQIVIFALPSVVWEDVAAGHLPELGARMDESSLAALSLPRFDLNGDSASVYASVGAGSRVRGHGEDDRQFFPQTVESPAGGMQISDWDRLAEHNAELDYGSVPGALGGALRRAGLRTAVVASASGKVPGPVLGEGEAGPVEDEFVKRTWAGLALADESGYIDAGDVSAALSAVDPSTTSGFRADAQMLESSFRDALEAADVVLVELSDTYREGQYLYSGRAQLDAEERIARRTNALARDDSNLARLWQHVDLQEDVVFVLGTGGMGPARRERLTVALVAGAGIDAGSYLQSGTARRAGLIAFSDVAPAILSAVDVPVPGSMVGSPIELVDSRGEDRLARLLEIQEKALFHLDSRSPFLATLAIVQLLLYLAVLAAWWVGRRAGSRLTRMFTLAFLSVPGVTFIWHALNAESMGLWAGPSLIALSALVALVSVAGPWRRWPIAPPTIVCAIAFVVIAVDLTTGARLQISSLMGYSPIWGARFFGLGNLAFAVFGTSALLALAPIGYLRRPWRVAIVVAAGVVTAVLTGAPVYGADFGGLLAVAVGFGVMTVYACDMDLTWPRVGLLVALAVAAGAAVGFADWLGEPASRTHIGRFFGQIIGGDFSAVGTTLQRKLTANVAIAERTYMSLLVPIIGFGLLFAFRVPRGRLRAAIAEIPTFRAAVIAAAALNFAGFLVNDSGIAIPAMGLAILVPFIFATVFAMPHEHAGAYVDDALVSSRAG